MHYSLECSELLADPRHLSPFGPEQQRENLNGSSMAAEVFIGQLLRIHLLDDTSLVSVPYLNAYVKHIRPQIPTIEAADTFARTKAAQTAIDETLTSFNTAAALASEIDPQHRLTIDQACGQLCVNKRRLLRVVALAPIELQPGEGRGIAKQHFSAEDLGLLYEWRYPESYRPPVNTIDSATPAS